jgi:hypothetical protein
MAKCFTCNSKKGKRKCVDTVTLICSECCGTARNKLKCAGCSFYKDEALNRNYKNIPYFPLQDLKNDFEIQNIAEIIERDLCVIDRENDINDVIAKKFIELLLDKYYFGDEPVIFRNEFEKQGFLMIDTDLKYKFPAVSNEMIFKVLGSIWRSINRHEGRRREYLDFINQFFVAY